MVNYQNKQQIEKIARFIREGIKSGEIKNIGNDPMKMIRMGIFLFELFEGVHFVFC